MTGGAIRRIRVGDATVTHVPDGRFALDGGAMYGVVPRVVWEQRSPPDRLHRIPLGLNAVVVERPGVRVLVDPGLGTRHDAAFAERFAVDQPPRLVESLALAGIPLESIDFVVDTHLHWDHAGANTVLGVEGSPVPLFPAARYVVQRQEWDAACRPHDRNRASYRSDDFVPLHEHGRLLLVDGEYELAPGIAVLPVGGHSDGMQLLRVDAGGATFVYLADLVPTRHHLDYAWVMGYDLYPVETLRQKQRLLPLAAEEDWVVGFAHDPDVPFGRVRLEGRHARPVLVPV